MRSMTGYGRGDGENDEIKIVAEIKAVNHRYSEIMVKQPRQYLSFEDPIKKLIAADVQRGRTEVFIKLTDISTKQNQVQIDKEKAVAYHKDLKEIAEMLQEEYTFDIYQLASLPEVIIQQEKEDDLKAAWVVVEKALSAALNQFLEMREREGSALKQDLVQKIGYMEQLVEQVAQASPVVVEEYKEKLRSRIAELMEHTVIDEERLAQEVAYFAEKSSIDEELVRLSSHFKQFYQIIDDEGSIGRKLDFLIQEMNRETNTIGSKANNLTIAKLVVELKSELEKVREQVQNIE